VKLEWKIVAQGCGSLRMLALAALLAVASGCGGLQGSAGISPASFFLPGLLKAEPVQVPSLEVPTPAPSVESVELAKAK